ncbi:polysaccharide pyruvyl transferase family protein [Paucibacter sp. TC2R-5]|uniref:polysaccharide pyruvyl transferase family protein n=1 Tax=Paucibacter sp. TC2R-5 TaxID=2893555 RepID=UPI0021E3CF98|nr:polysaccharide pyruvyl transferase family protein [Paucibacter sp. TC2R-5]MCV2361772.1 polysaccharide pyruvyl transferase family protein [Paucibacter sp. TC2R-5]
MRILFYVFPGILPQGPEFTAGWALLLGRLRRGLAAREDVHTWMVVPERQRTYLVEANLDTDVGYVDELSLQRGAQAAFADYASLTRFGEDVRENGDRPNLAQSLVLKHVAIAAAGFEPDVVVTFGMPARYLNCIWPAAVVFHAEVSAFSRNPYPMSMFLDHVGIYRSAAFSGKEAAHHLTGFTSSKELLDDFRRSKHAALQQHDPFKDMDWRHRFPRLVLLPLQVSNYFSFDEQCVFRTQFEYLLGMLDAMSGDVGVIVTEYVQWGHVLEDAGPNRNLRWLRERYPQLIFNEAFRGYESSSQYLLPRVEGVYTVTSNLGIQSLLLRKRLGTAVGSFLAGLAHDEGGRAFFGEVSAGKPEPRDGFLRWYLERYAVPMTLLENGDWLVDYLRRRCKAIRQAGDGLGGFVAVDTTAILREHWLDEKAISAAGRYETPRLSMARYAAIQEVDGLVAAEQALARRADLDLGGPGYLLLNDTRSIDGFSHLGSNAVTGLIEDELTQAGLTCLARVSLEEDCVKVLERLDMRRLRIAVFNGEDSIHHDNPRIRRMMDLCVHLRDRGVACVLINSVWHANTAATGKLLECFDIVAVRESRSLTGIREWRPDARLVPDLTLAAFPQQGFAANSVRAYNGNRSGLVVLDHVHASATDALMSFARHQQLPAFLMGRLHVPTRIAAAGGSWLLGQQAYPRIFRSADAMAKATGCVTGRYHGLIAALCAGVPSLALPTNTPMIEGLFGDVGLDRKFLLPASWRSTDMQARMHAVEESLSLWGESESALVQAYRESANEAIQRLFNDIRFLALDPATRPAAQVHEDKWSNCSPTDGHQSLHSAFG